MDETLPVLDLRHHNRFLHGLENILSPLELVRLRASNFTSEYATFQVKINSKDILALSTSDASIVLFALIAVYFYRLNNYDNFSTRIVKQQKARWLNINLDSEFTFADVISYVAAATQDEFFIAKMKAPAHIINLHHYLGLCTEISDGSIFAINIGCVC